MQMEFKSSWIKFISSSILVLVGIYVVLRAIYVPLFSAEVITFFVYVKSGGFDPFLALQSAHNHVLNSAFVRLSSLVFGDSPLALRLPNVLAYFLFAYCVLITETLFNEPFFGLVWLLVMFSSHYMYKLFPFGSWLWHVDGLFDWSHVLSPIKMEAF